ncbi:MAG: IS481 family transposase [Rhodospirillaceae bacterium]
MHGCARTTIEMRDLIRTSDRSVRALAAELGLNPKTVAKWKSRETPADAPMGPGRSRLRYLSPAEEAMCVGFRKHALLPLDDCLYALQLTFPHLTRASLHRLYRRHGISRLPAGGAARRSAVGDFYVDSSDVRTGDGMATMFIAFDRTSRLAFAELYESPERDNAAAFLAHLVGAVPYAVRRVLTSDGPQFLPSTEAAESGETGAAGAAGAAGANEPFAAICRKHGIAHDLIATSDPWTIARDGRQQRSRRDPRTPCYYRDHDHLRQHFFAFFDSYNFTRRLKTLKGRTPYEFVCRFWEREPRHFRVAPHDHVPRLSAPVHRPITQA